MTKQNQRHILYVPYSIDTHLFCSFRWGHLVSSCLEGIDSVYSSVFYSVALPARGQNKIAGIPMLLQAMGTTMIMSKLQFITLRTILNMLIFGYKFTHSSRTISAQ